MEAPLHLKPGVFLLPETFNLEKICKAGQIPASGDGNHKE
jgi:hypothetical protein